MLTLSNSIAYLCTCLLLALVTAQDESDGFMKRDHSLVRPFLSSAMTIPNWDMYGSTLATTNFIRLTADVQSQRGSVWNQVPVVSRNWELVVSFKVHGHGKDLFGDGFAVWYARDRLWDGPVFGSRDQFSGLAIILDTYSNHNGPHNHQHPYISAMVNNGSMTYDHDRDGTLTQLNGCEAKFRNVDIDTSIKIRYENDVLTVYTDLENKRAWRTCFTVEGVKLPTGYFFGASAATGDLSDNHDILAIKMYELEHIADGQDRSHIIPSAIRTEPPRERHEDPKSGMSNVKIFFLILFTMLIVCALVVAAKYFYENYQKNSRKRLY